MRRKIACFYLILVLMSTWTDNRKTSAYFIVPPPDAPSTASEFYPLSMRDRVQNLDTVEAPPLARMDQAPFSIASFVPRVICSRLENVIPCMYAGAHACYVLMSLKR